MAPHGELKRISTRPKKGVREGIIKSTHIKVCNGPSWVDGSSDHLEKLVGCNSVAQTCKKKRREWCDYRATDKGYDVRPNGQRCFTMEHTDETYAEKALNVRH